jgi:hypothetical protein
MTKNHSSEKLTADKTRSAFLATQVATLFDTLPCSYTPADILVASVLVLRGSMTGLLQSTDDHDDFMVNLSTCCYFLDHIKEVLLAHAVPGAADQPTRSM